MALKSIGLALLFFGAVLASAAPAESSDYRLAVGDRVKVTVFGHEDLSGEFEVSATGHIVMPLIRDVQARDRTIAELEVAIVDALSPEYLKQPRVGIEVLAYRPLYIVGEVTLPGSYPYVTGMTVVTAVAVAGGFTYRARKSKITIQREDNGNIVKFGAALDTPVRPGDVIEVPERFF